ncbi:TPA: ThiF family adenylyltransferase [Candidatus Woesearchaeota archaeon]|nr:ThiF family adenylyltransferase [Candidatus Woesearchaeota archaeon]
MKDKIFVVRDAVSLFLKKQARSKYILAFLFQSSRILASFEVSPLALECVKLLDGNHSLGQIARMKKITQKNLLRLIHYLESENLIEERWERTKEELRYSRQLNFFASFEEREIKRENFQKKIEDARVVVLGAGGIGTWLIESLVRSGVGQITVIDPDVIALSNLSRQTFFTEKDIGKAKVEIVKKHAAAINSMVKIKPVQRLIVSPRDLRPFVKNATLVINCSDYPDVSVTNDIVSRACFTYGIPHILCGGYAGHLSFVGQTVIPHQSSCWRCYVEGGIYERGLNGFTHMAITRSSVEGGTLAAIASMTANIHALEALKVITGYAEPAMLNAKAEWDFLSLSLTKITVSKNKYCSLCGENAQKRRIRK